MLIKKFRNFFSNLFKKPSKGKRVIAPTVLQMEAVECGAASLKIILEYYKKYVPLVELRVACGVSRDGSKAANIVKAARIYNLDAKGLKIELEKIFQLEPPFIVFWEFNHFLVVEGYDGQSVYLSDPAVGKRSVSHKQFDEGYTGVAIMSRPGVDFQKGGEKPDVLLSLRKRLKGSYNSLSAVVILGILLVVPEAAIPVFSGQYLDQVIVQGRHWLMPIVWGIGIAGAINLLLQQFQLTLLNRLNTKLSVEMSSRFLWHLLLLPANFYVQRSSGDISTRVQYNNKIAGTLSGPLASSAVGVLTMFIFAIILFSYDFLLTAIVIFLAGINFYVLQLISRERVDTNMSLMQDYGRVSGFSMSGIEGIESIKSQGLEGDFFARWSGYFTKYNNNQQQLGSQTQIFSVLPSLVSSITNISIMILGGFKVMQGEMTLGGFMAFTQLSAQFLAPVNGLVGLGNQIQELVGDINRLDDILENPIDEDITKGLSISFSPDDKARLEGKIEFKNLSFAYSKIDKPLIDDFNYLILPGQKIGLVGASGCGKSTLAKLLTGLYQVTSGEILFDDKPRSQISRNILTNSIAMVDQDIVLFEGSVKYNLNLWDNTISDRDILRACQDAYIHDDILALPNGYDTVLIEGATNLSGGQRQRLEIARALVHNPTILIMDEATSALDSNTEKKVTELLKRRGCTCLIIAHRLSTLKDCDQILVFVQGKIEQQGTHEQLKQDTDGYYAQLLKAEEQLTV